MAKSYSQNWQDVKSVRAQNVWYTNTTNEDMMVVVNAAGRGMTAFIATAESGYSTSIRIAATIVGAAQDFNDRHTWTFIVRPNDQYLMSGPSIPISSWTELITRSTEVPGPGSQICFSDLSTLSSSNTKNNILYHSYKNVGRATYGNGTGNIQFYIDFDGSLDFSQFSLKPLYLIFCFNCGTSSTGPTHFGGDIQIKRGTNGEWVSIQKRFDTSRIPGWSEDRTYFTTYNGFIEPIDDVYYFRVGVFNSFGGGNYLTVNQAALSVFGTTWEG